MKLSYREKIGLLIFLVAVVIIIFIAWPIKLIRGNIKSHTAEKARVEEEYNNTKNLIAQIPEIEANITKVYNESKVISEKFAPHMDNIAFDKYFEQLLNKEPYKNATKNAIELKGGLSIADESVGGVPFYYYSPNVITYPILEAADTNGNLTETKDPVLYEKVVNASKMSELTSQTVEVRNATLNLKFTKEALLNLEDELQKNGTGIRITGVNINDYTFAFASDIPEEKGYSEGTVTFSFYTLQQIQEPKFSE